jgi:hypothetical protein
MVIEWPNSVYATIGSHIENAPALEEQTVFSHKIDANVISHRVKAL